MFEFLCWGDHGASCSWCHTLKKKGGVSSTFQGVKTTCGIASHAALSRPLGLKWPTTSHSTCEPNPMLVGLAQADQGQLPSGPRPRSGGWLVGFAVDKKTFSFLVVCNHLLSSQTNHNLTSPKPDCTHAAHTGATSVTERCLRHTPLRSAHTRVRLG